MTLSTATSALRMIYYSESNTFNHLFRDQTVLLS